MAFLPPFHQQTIIWLALCRHRFNCVWRWCMLSGVLVWKKITFLCPDTTVFSGKNYKWTLFSTWKSWSDYNDRENKMICIHQSWTPTGSHQGKISPFYTSNHADTCTHTCTEREIGAADDEKMTIFSVHSGLLMYISIKQLLNASFTEEWSVHCYSYLKMGKNVTQTKMKNGIVGPQSVQETLSIVLLIWYYFNILNIFYDLSSGWTLM